MQEVGLVDHLQRVEQRGEDGVELLLARRASQRLEPPLQALALLEVEHHVAGLVVAEVAVELDDIGVVELGERLRFLDEALEPPIVVACRVLRARQHVDAVGARGDVARKVFLDGDGPAERKLLGEIRDAEAASSQHTLDAVVADQHCPAW